MTTNFPDDTSSSTPLFAQTGQTTPLPTSGDPLSASHDSASGSGTGNGSGTGKSDAAKEQAGKVASDAQDASQHVAGVAKDQAGAVASEAKNQAKDLYAQTTSQLKEQAGTQQQRVAEGLRSVSDELSSMADKSDGNGLASELVRNLSGRAGSAAGFLDGRDPGSLLDEVKSFAARKPGTFIAIAAGAGILAGRLTKALAADAKASTESTAPSASAPTATSGSTTAPTQAPATNTTDPLSAAAPTGGFVDTRSFEEVVEGVPLSARSSDGDLR